MTIDRSHGAMTGRTSLRHLVGIISAWQDDGWMRNYISNRLCIEIELRKQKKAVNLIRDEFYT